MLSASFQVQGLEATTVAACNLMWGSYQSHWILFLLDVASHAGFPPFPVASLSTAGSWHSTQAADETVREVITVNFFRAISNGCTMCAIVFNISSKTSVWWELKIFLQSQAVKGARSGRVMRMEKRSVSFLIFYFGNFLGFWVKIRLWIPVITML